MTDPEILEPEDAGTGDAGADTSAGVHRLVAAVERALPGRTVRVDVQDAARARLPIPTGPRFRIEAEGTGGSIIVESGPLFTVLVRFRNARFSFDVGPAGKSADDVLARVVDRVRRLAGEELVVVEEQRTPQLMRTTLLAVDNGRVTEIVDSGLLPSGGVVAGPVWYSFGGTFSGALSKQQKATVDRLGGGLVGKLKRTLAEKVFSAATDTLKKSIDRAAQRQSGHGDVTGDDGRRKLGQ